MFWRRKDNFTKNNKNIRNNYTNNKCRKNTKCKIDNYNRIKNKKIKEYKNRSPRNFLSIKDILSIIYIFEESNAKEIRLFLLPEAEIEYQSYSVNRILKINFQDKMNYVNKINKRILSISTNIENYIIVKKYLILYFFSDDYYKNTIIFRLQKLEVIFNT